MRFVPTNPTTQVAVRDKQTGTEVDAAHIPDAGPSYDDGFRDGRAEAEAKARAQFTALQQQLSTWRNQLPQALNASLVQMQQQFEEQACLLAFQIAEWVIHREVSEKSIIEDVIRQGLKTIPHWREGKLRVHPVDASILQNLDTSVLSSQLNVQPDPSLQPGDVILETDNGDYDGSVNTRLQELFQQVADQLSAYHAADETEEPD